jgi:hypothetical protein
MCAVGWSVKELREQRKLIIDLQNSTIFDIRGRLAEIERRRPAPEAAAQPTAPAPKLRYRTWNEDAVMPEKSN